MKNNQINFKLINIALIILIIFLLNSISGVLTGLIGKILEITFPFLLGFAIAYALYPFVKKLEDNSFPKWLAIFIVCFITIGFLILMCIIVVPMLYDQTLLFINNLSTFISDISDKYSLNLGTLETSIKEMSTDLVSSLGKYLSNGAINILNTSINIITNMIVTVCVAIYFLFDMDKIREYIKKRLKSKKNRGYRYVSKLDGEITNYFSGMGKNMIIQFFEYTIVFFLIGHPNYLVLGILAAVTNIIPYFGALIVNVLALLIASVISTKLFILSVIVIIVCPSLDGYVIGPKVYGKSNQLHPLVTIFAVFAGGILGGFWGIVVALPVAIIIIATYKFFKEDINDKIEKIRQK